jgi:hypothetical protein
MCPGSAKSSRSGREGAAEVDVVGKRKSAGGFGQDAEDGKEGATGGQRVGMSEKVQVLRSS